MMKNSIAGIVSLYVAAFGLFVFVGLDGNWPDLSEAFQWAWFRFWRYAIISIIILGGLVTGIVLIFGKLLEK